MSELARCQRDHWHDLIASRAAQCEQRAELAEIWSVPADFSESDWRTDHQITFDGKAATVGKAQNCSLSACDLSRRVCRSKLMYWSRRPRPIQTVESARPWPMALDDRLRPASHNSPLANARGGMIGGISKNVCRENGLLASFFDHFAVPFTESNSDDPETCRNPSAQNRESNRTDASMPIQPVQFPFTRSSDFRGLASGRAEPSDVIPVAIPTSPAAEARLAALSLHLVSPASVDFPEVIENLGGA